MFVKWISLTSFILLKLKTNYFLGSFLTYNLLSLSVLSTQIGSYLASLTKPRFPNLGSVAIPGGRILCCVKLSCAL